MPLSMLLVVQVLAFIASPVSPGFQTLTMFQILDVVTLVNCTVFIGIGALPMHLIL